jgi:hypothetical protein
MQIAVGHRAGAPDDVLAAPSCYGACVCLADEFSSLKKRESIKRNREERPLEPRLRPPSALLPSREPDRALILCKGVRGGGGDTDVSKINGA